MSCIYQVFYCYEVLKENYAFLDNFSFNIRLFSIMAWVYSIRLQINSRKFNFNNQFIYMVYTMYIPALGIYMVYAWYIHGIYHVKHLYRFQMH